MNATRDADAILAAWLDDGPLALPDDTRRAIAVGLRTTPQRRGRFGRLGGSTRASSPLALRLAAAFGALALIGAIAFVTWQDRLPAIVPGASPSPSPSPAPVTLPTYSDELRCDAPGRDPCQYPRLQPGTYAPGDQFPLELTFAISGADTDWRGFAGPQFVFLHGKPLSQRVRERTQVSLFLWAASELFADPCAQSFVGRMPGGSSTDELLETLNGFSCATAELRGEVAIGQYRAARVEMAWECADGAQLCPFPLIPTTDTDHPGTDLHCGAVENRCDFLVIDASPPLVLKVVSYSLPGPTSPAVEAEFVLILNSLRVTPGEGTR
jgi:hypothetical protein